jgi:hypothetical protein
MMITMMQSFDLSTRSSLRLQKLLLELRLALQQRRAFGSPRIRATLDRRICDLKAELVVFGWS